MNTSSIGIIAWAGKMDIEEVLSVGEGDSKVVAWRRSDGEVALETNGDPVFGYEAEQFISENSK